MNLLNRLLTTFTILLVLEVVNKLSAQGNVVSETIGSGANSKTGAGANSGADSGTGYEAISVTVQSENLSYFFNIITGLVNMSPLSFHFGSNIKYIPVSTQKTPSWAF